MIKRVCVFCGANSGNHPLHRETARLVGRTLARKGIELVYGGSSVGLMLELANAALEAGGRVIGVIPQLLVEREQAHRGLSELRIVDSMHERKANMAALSEAFIAMPGGFGTLDEIFEMLSWAQLGIHDKPCGFLNLENYYASLLEFLDIARAEGFLRPEHHAKILVASDIEMLLTLFENRSTASTPPARGTS